MKCTPCVAVLLILLAAVLSASIGVLVADTVVGR